jgi:hypothetical protein
MEVMENVLTDSTHHTLKHILHTFRRDIHDFLQHGDLSDHLYDVLYDYYHNDMPYGVAKARSGDPYEWISDRLHQDLSDHGVIDEGGITIRQRDDGTYEEDPTGHTLEKQMALTSTPEPYTGPTAGGVPATLPAGVNRLQVNKPAPAPAPAAPAAQAPAGPTAGGVPANLPAGINRLTGKPNAPATPVNECNYTMENEYCPVHGLEECYGSSMFESELARIKQLMK